MSLLQNVLESIDFRSQTPVCSVVIFGPRGQYEIPIRAGLLQLYSTNYKSQNAHRLFWCINHKNTFIKGKFFYYELVDLLLSFYFEMSYQVLEKGH